MQIAELLLFLLSKIEHPSASLAGLLYLYLQRSFDIKRKLYSVSQDLFKRCQYAAIVSSLFFLWPKCNSRIVVVPSCPYVSPLAGVFKNRQRIDFSASIVVSIWWGYNSHACIFSLSLVVYKVSILHNVTQSVRLVAIVRRRQPSWARKKKKHDKLYIWFPRRLKKNVCLTFLRQCWILF